MLIVVGAHVESFSADVAVIAILSRVQLHMSLQTALQSVLFTTF